MRKRHAITVAALVLAALVVLVTAAWAGRPHDDLKAAKRATEQYRDLDVAKAAGYGLITDAQGIACIAEPGVGAMGVHYGNSALIGDPTIDPTQPEAFVYEPRAHGRLKLVALEYLVFQADWDATHNHPPMLFGQMFMLTPAPNRFGIPAFYSLHAWIYKHNPAGEFAMWNPDVHCDRPNTDDGD
jgi:hypothetical protein